MGRRRLRRILMFRPGYWKTEEEYEAAKYAIRRGYLDAKHRLATLKVTAKGLAKELEQLAGQIKDTPENLTYDPSVLAELNEKIAKILDDIKKTANEVGEGQYNVRDIGLEQA
jgi:peptidoglycan hydrolase CwlO-like protein